MVTGHHYPLPAIGAKVKVVESASTTNWSRIDVGRIGTVAGYQPYAFTVEQGPRVFVLVTFDTVERWDGGRTSAVSMKPDQLV